MSHIFYLKIQFGYQVTHNNAQTKFFAKINIKYLFTFCRFLMLQTDESLITHHVLSLVVKRKQRLILFRIIKQVCFFLIMAAQNCI